jgi:DNA-binding SARP family transcriptional activator
VTNVDNVARPATGFGILGPLLLPRGAAPLTAPKLRGILTLLLLSGGPVPPAQIREALEDQHAGTGSLHVAVHRLRRWLEPSGHGLLLEPAGYRLQREPGTTDADRFRALLADARSRPDGPDRIKSLLRALSLWRGPVAADAPDRVRDQYAARHLEHHRRSATIEVTTAALATGTPGAALPVIERLARECPYDEQVQSLLALTLAAGGRQREALALLDLTRRTLSTQLGVDPSDHLRDALSYILRRSRRRIAA